MVLKNVPKSVGSLALLEVILPKVGPGGNGSALLELGCGDGKVAACLHRRFPRVLAIDIDVATVKETERSFGHQPGLEFRVGDAHELSKVVGEDEVFDCVVSIFALHHMRASVVLDAVKQHLRPRGRVVIVDIYADHKESIFSYLIDQFLWSCVRRPGAIVESIRRLGLSNAARYIWWRLSYSFSKSGCQHIKQDLLQRIPMTLSEWRAVFDESLPGSSLTLVVGSTLVLSWPSD